MDNTNYLQNLTDEDYLELFNIMPLSKKRELIFSEFRRKHRITNLFRECPFDELKDMVDRFQQVYEERLKLEKEKEAERRIKEEKVRAILKQMEEEGVEFDALAKIREQLLVESGRYKFVKDGALWTGQGRRPAPFKGLSPAELEHFRISGS